MTSNGDAANSRSSLTIPTPSVSTFLDEVANAQDQSLAVRIRTRGGSRQRNSSTTFSTVTVTSAMTRKEIASFQATCERNSNQPCALPTKLTISNAFAPNVWQDSSTRAPRDTRTQTEAAPSLITISPRTMSCQTRPRNERVAHSNRCHLPNRSSRLLTRIAGHCMDHNHRANPHREQASGTTKKHSRDRW